MKGFVDPYSQYPLRAARDRAFIELDDTNRQRFIVHSSPARRLRLSLSLSQRGPRLAQFDSSAADMATQSTRIQVRRPGAPLDLFR